jgi:hypothetical protein
MGSKASFTDEEWQDLQWAVMLAGSHITASDWPGLWKSFKEAAGGSRFLTLMQGSDNQLVKDLASDQARKRPPEIKDRAGLAGDLAIARIRDAVAIVAARAPEDLEDFKLLLTNVAQAMAEEVDGVSPKEAEAVARVRAALDSPADPA